jgi:hypothetical protein
MTSRLARHGLVAALVHLALTSVTGCAGIQTIDTGGISTVNLADLIAEPRELGDRMMKQGLIIRVPAGSTVPLKLRADISIMTLEHGVNTVRFNRDVYFYVSRGKFMISPDGERWAHLHQPRAVKELFGLAKRGSFSLGLGASKKEGVFFSLAIEQPR